MLFTYIELRYLRQIKKLSPKSLLGFKELLIASVKTNGGSFQEYSGAFIISISSRECAPYFSMVRILDNLKTLLSQHKQRINEYFILVDYAQDSLNSDQIYAQANSYKNDVYPDDIILCTEEAQNLLAPYCILNPIRNTRFIAFGGKKQIQKNKIFHKTASETHSYNFYVSEKKDPIHDLILFLDTYYNNENSFDLNEKQDFAHDYKKAVSIYKKYRFFPTHPAYRIQTIIHFSHTFFDIIAKTLESSVRIHVWHCEQVSIPLEYQNLFTQFSEQIVFEPSKLSSNNPFDIASIPPDFLELVFLVYKLSDYIYFEEYENFFNFIGKSKEFFDDFALWLFEFGLLSEVNDFRTLRQISIVDIESRLHVSTNSLTILIANFLWMLFDSGTVLPVPDSVDTLKKFGFVVPDLFIIRCLYATQNFNEKNLEYISNPLLRKTILQSQDAICAYNMEQFEESARLAKNALHVFQTHKITVCEFEMLSLASLISLAQKKIDDAVVYAEYTLEVSKQFFEPYSICYSTTVQDK